MVQVISSWLSSSTSDSPSPERQPGSLSGDQRRGGAVGELAHRQQAFEPVGRLEVQRAQLDRDHQHARCRIRAHDMACGPQRGDACVATHEPDHHALDRRRETEPAGEHLVEPGRGEAGAAGHHHVGDAVDLSQPGDRFERELGRLAGVDGHAIERARRVRHVVEAALGLVGMVVRQHREAVADTRTLDHAIEQAGLTAAVELPLGPGVVRRLALAARNRAGDGIDAGLRRRHDHETPRWPASACERTMKRNVMRLCRRLPPGSSQKSGEALITGAQ
jgi:hypothetical protein